MCCPGPDDHRPLLVQGEQIAESFSVAVPEFLAGDGSAQGAPADLAHGVPGRIEQHDGVGAGQDEVGDGRVVAVNDPRLTGGTCSTAAWNSGFGRGVSAWQYLFLPFADHV